MTDMNVNSHWTTVKLTYTDGFTVEVTLDPQAIEQLMNPESKERIMTEIRNNLEASSVELPASSSQTASSTAPMVVNQVLDLAVEQQVEDASGSDVEDEQQASYTLWPRDAVLYLITLYKLHETELEDTRTRKKDVWEKITQKMNLAGYNYSQTKIENKWRGLLKSHKLVRDNKNKTGSKRKTFQFFEEIEEIVVKRHDINPPFVAGSGSRPKTTKFSTRPQALNVASGGGDNQLDNANTNKTDSQVVSFSTSSTAATEIITEASSSESSLELSNSRSAKARRERHSSANNDGACETLKFLREMEQARQADNQERERNRNSRAAEKNALLREFLDVFKSQK